MANILQTAIHYFARQSMRERTDRETQGLFLDRIYEDHIARYNFAASFVTNKTVLDIACGDGYGTTILAKKAKMAIGVDISAKTIDEAKRKYKTGDFPAIQFVCSDAIAYFNKNKRKFDVIITYETIEHIKEFELFLLLAKKNLKLGGLIILSTPNKIFSDLLAGDTFNPYHVKEFYNRELANILTNVFDQKPQVYCQRPVQKNRILWSFFQAFVLQKESFIIRETSKIIGIDMIYLVRNIS